MVVQTDRQALASDLSYVNLPCRVPEDVHTHPTTGADAFERDERVTTGEGKNEQCTILDERVVDCW